MLDRAAAPLSDVRLFTPSPSCILRQNLSSLEDEIRLAVGYTLAGRPERDLRAAVRLRATSALLIPTPPALPLLALTSSTTHRTASSHLGQRSYAGVRSLSCPSTHFEAYSDHLPLQLTVTDTSPRSSATCPPPRTLKSKCPAATPQRQFRVTTTTNDTIQNLRSRSRTFPTRRARRVMPGSCRCANRVPVVDATKPALLASTVEVVVAPTPGNGKARAVSAQAEAPLPAKKVRKERMAPERPRRARGISIALESASTVY